jgi:hypothetical protein
VDRYSFEIRSWEVGATAGVGFEWFFKRKLSVLGRVGANLAFGKQHESTSSAYDVSDPNTYSSRRTNYSTVASTSSSSALGLAVYF